MTDPDPTARRLEHLEAAVRLLRDDLAALRAELRLQRAVPAEPVAPRPVGLPRPVELPSAAESREPTAEDRPRPRVSRGPERLRMTMESGELESMVGRYGTLALGALTILMAVGAFLGWAITNNLLRITPGMRVALGFVAAATIATLGWRMRDRASKRFGNTLLALALAVVHVDAWGAGPYLGLFPQAVALAIAAVASAALAALALREDEEALFAVGFGGALVAPFVTSTGRGDVVALLTYGVVVIGLGLVVLRGRTWAVGSRIAGVSGSVYALAGVAGGSLSSSAVVHLAPTVFALACAWLAALLAGDRDRAGLARAFLAVGVLVLAATNEFGVGEGYWVAAGFLGLVSVYAIGLLSSSRPSARPGRPGAVVEGVVTTLLLPLGYLAATLAKIDDAPSADGAMLASAWTVGALVMTRLDAKARRVEHLAAALLASALGLTLALHERASLCLALLAAHAILSSVLLRRLRAPVLLLPALAVLAPAAIWAYAELRARPEFQYTPFLGQASVAASAVSIAWAVFSWQASRTEWPGAVPELLRHRAAVRGAGGLIAFLWVREELLRFASPDQATFSLIFYYALTGVVAISVGRHRSFAELRRWGLALAIYAAAKAVLQASGLGSIGFKVGSYVVVGIFLLAVAYWYRAGGERPAAA